MALHPEFQKLLDTIDTDLQGLTLQALTESSKKPATLAVENGRLWLNSPYYPASMADIKAVPGRQYDAATKRWSFPADQFQAVYKLTTTHFPNTKVPVLGLARALGAVLKAPGLPSVTFTEYGKSWLVFSPYNPKFVDGIKSIPGRKWVGDQKAWSFPKSMLDTVVKLAKDCYGENEVAEPTA